MSDESKGEFDFTFTIDGQTVGAHKGDTILKAGLRAGVFIPHYCWHPGLSIAGNCRICLVYATKAGPPGKPVIACNTEALDGMEVESEGARTKQAREGVMEFLLANHPLDCPVCDQAGECDLQQYSFDYGRESSPFVEEKTQKGRKDLGPLIRFAGNRCITCTRCVRFCDEVAGTGELTVVNRGDASTIDTFPGLELDNPLSGCTADLCPVGALLEKDSLHSTRVWLLRSTESVCGHCATGCNINVETWKDQVRRLTPRENQAVNRWWMCDEGRLSHRLAQDPERVRQARLGGEDVPYARALERAQELVRGLGAKAVVGAMATAHSTNEELFVLEALTGGGPLAVVGMASGQAWRSRDGFEISADRNPNWEGVRQVLGESACQPEPLREALSRGEVELLVVVDAMPGGAPWGDELTALAGKAKHRVVITLRDGPLCQGADVVLPAAHWTEKDGSFVNGRGRLQRVRAALPPLQDGRSDLDALQELARARGLVPRVLSAAGVFKRLQAALPACFQGLTYNSIGAWGVPLPGAADTTPAAACSTGYEAGPTSRGHNRANDEQTRPAVHRTYAAGYGTSRGSI